MNDSNILNEVVIVHLDFNIWSGQKRLSPADLKLGDGGEVPPSSFASLGHKKICDPKSLRVFDRLKSKAHRFLQSKGMPFLNGYAVPITQIQEIETFLESVSQEFDGEKASFGQVYQQTITQWVNENADYRDAISGAIISKEEVMARLNFDYSTFEVQTRSGSPGGERTSKKLGGLADELLDEVVASANDFYSKRIAFKESLHKRTQETLKKIRDKVEGLSFLDPVFGSVVDLLDNALSGYALAPKSGSLRGESFYKVAAAVLIACNREQIIEYGEGAHDLELNAKRLMQDSSVPHDPTQFDNEKVTAPTPATQKINPLVSNGGTSGSNYF